MIESTPTSRTRIPQEQPSGYPSIAPPDSRTVEHLLITLDDLADTLHGLHTIAKNFEKHELLDMYRSRWRLALHHVILGMCFAIGTVLGLVLLSWLTYNFFKDSETLRHIVDSQLQQRQFDISGIQKSTIDEINRHYGTLNQMITDGTKGQESFFTGSTGAVR